MNKENLKQCYKCDYLFYDYQIDKYNVINRIGTRKQVNLCLKCAKELKEW